MGSGDLQVLLSTINKYDYGFIRTINLQSDAIIANQNGMELCEEWLINDNKIKWICTKEKGLSNNRNLTLSNATAEIALLCDDDVIYCKEYPRIIQRAYRKYPDADIIIFNLEEKVPTRYITKRDCKVKFLNFMRYGSVRISFKVSSIRNANISFDTRFGAGAGIPCGEDTIFLHDCLKQGLKIYAVTDCILGLSEERSSTWFTGYNQDYFINKGKLYKRISPFFSYLLILQDALRHKKRYGKEYSFINIVKLMNKGRKQF